MAALGRFWHIKCATLDMIFYYDASFSLEQIYDKNQIISPHVLSNCLRNAADVFQDIGKTYLLQLNVFFFLFWT